MSKPPFLYISRILPATIRGKLILLIGMSIIALFSTMTLVTQLGLPFGIYEGNYKRHESEVIMKLNAIADDKQNDINQWFNERFDDLNLSSYEPLLLSLISSYNKGKKPDPPDCRKLEEWFSILNKNKHYEAISLLDSASRKIIFTTDTIRAGITDSFYDNLFRKESESNMKLLFDKGGSPNGSYIYFASLISAGRDQNNHPTGRNLALIFKVDAYSSLKSILHSSDVLGESGEIILIDKQKILLTPLKYPLPDGTKAIPISHRLMTKPAEYVSKGVDGLLRTRDYRGVPVVAAVRYSRITPDFGLGMIIKQNEKEIFDPIKKSLTFSISIISSGLVILLLTIYFVAVKLLKPLEELGETANKLTNGDFSARVEYERKDELGMLAQTFNIMAEKIQGRHQELETAVNQRTAALIEANSMLKKEMEERKRAETAHIASEKRYRELLENVHLVAVILDTQGIVTFANDFFLTQTGWYKEDVIGANWFELFVPESEKETVKTIFNEAITKGLLPTHYEYGITTREGKQRSIVWDNSLLHNADDSIAGIASIGIDVTEHRSLEEQLRHSQKMEAIGQLAGGVAHDFNNILQVIIGFSTLIQSSLDDNSPLRSDITHVLESANRAANLTRSLLAFSRKQAMNPQSANLNTIVLNIEKFLIRIIGEDIELKTVIAEMPLNIYVDVGQIEQLLFNLATNARDAMPKGGLLSIETTMQVIEESFVKVYGYGTPGNYAVLSVSDTGVGMSEDTRQRIFEPFFTTKEVDKGTGLGLSIVYGIVKQHDGYINVYSQEDIGTTFRIYLPISTQLDELSEVKSDFTIQEKGSGTILVAEDDPSVRRLVESLLIKYGFQVILAENGQDAINLFKQEMNNIQLILMDMIMPGKSGMEAYKEIRLLKPGTKVIFTSGYTAEMIQNRGELDEGMELLMKPIQPLMLIRKVKEMIDD